MKKNQIIGGIAGGIFFLAMIGYLFGGGVEMQAESTMNEIKNQVANDSIQQYEMVKRNGNKTEACVHAGVVKAAYLQANDEENYKKWQQVEKADCAAAGMPSFN